MSEKTNPLIQKLRTAEYQKRVEQEILGPHAAAIAHRYIARVLSWLGTNSSQTNELLSMAAKNSQALRKLIGVITGYAATDARIGDEIVIYGWEGSKGPTIVCIPTVKYYMRMLRTIEGLHISQPQCALEGEDFWVGVDTSVGPRVRVVHTFNMQNRRATPQNLLSVYVPYTYKGEDDILVISRDVVNAAQKKSGRQEVWKDFYEQMAQKTALRQMVKIIPLPHEIARALDAPSELSESDEFAPRDSSETMDAPADETSPSGIPLHDESDGSRPPFDDAGDPPHSEEPVRSAPPASQPPVQPPAQPPASQPPSQGGRKRGRPPRSDQPHGQESPAAAQTDPPPQSSSPPEDMGYDDGAPPVGQDSNGDNIPF